MWKRALISLTLIAGSTIAALNSKAPADAGLKAEPGAGAIAQPTKCLLAGSHSEMPLRDRGIILVGGESEVAFRASTH